MDITDLPDGEDVILEQAGLIVCRYISRRVGESRRRAERCGCHACLAYADGWRDWAGQNADTCRSGDAGNPSLGSLPEDGLRGPTGGGIWRVR